MKSTKLESFEKTNHVLTNTRVHDFVLANPHTTRRLIAEGTKLRLSTVCGAVNRLIKDGKITVTGRVYDMTSDRNVETVGKAPAEFQAEVA